MNCDTCGNSTSLLQSDCVCCTNCNNPTSDSTSSIQQPESSSSSSNPSSSTSTSLNLPYRGRRWMLRRATARNKQDSSPASSSTSSSPSAPLSDLDDRKLINTSRIPVDVDVEIGTILSEIPDGPCDFPNIQSNSQPSLEQDGPNIDVDVDLDAQSMIVSAAQSETASTISRAAFSVSDRAENDPREHVGLLIDSQPTRDDHHHHHEQPIHNIEKQPLSTKNIRQRVQAAYFRELMLSSLRL